MPLAHMKPMLRHALSNKYGIAAFNMIDFNSARSVVDGAHDLDAPIIIQVSVKTIRHWGFKAIAEWVKHLASDVDTPVALHLDHCTDLEIIKGCIDAGWTSVMLDGSALPFSENMELSKKAYELADAAGVGLEAEIGAIGGVEDDKAVNEEDSMLADLEECKSFCEEMPDLAAFAPAIGTAHGFYRGEPEIAYELLSLISAAVNTPIALHGGTGLSDEQFRRCIASGCAKVNISTMHKRQFIEGFVGLRAREPKQSEPIPFIKSQYEAMKEDVKLMVETFGSKARAESCMASL